MLTRLCMRTTSRSSQFLFQIPTISSSNIQNLRECIIQTKWKYDVAPEDRQLAYREMIINFIQRYFFTICFAQYALQHGRSGYQTSFTLWMAERPELQDMVEAGKDKLEWSRSVDSEMLDQLRRMMTGPDYKSNLQPLIRTIYQFAFQVGNRDNNKKL